MDNKREQVYDKHIAPLMLVVYQLAVDNDIPMVAQFELDDRRYTTTRAVGLTASNRMHLLSGAMEATAVSLRKALVNEKLFLDDLENGESE